MPSVTLVPGAARMVANAAYRAARRIGRHTKDLLFLAAGLVTTVWLLVLTIYTVAAVLSIMWLMGAILLILLMPLLARTVRWERHRLRLVTAEVPPARPSPPRPRGVLARITDVVLTSVNSAEFLYLLSVLPVAAVTGATSLGLWLWAGINLVNPMVGGTAGGAIIAVVSGALAIPLARASRHLQVRLAVTMLGRAADPRRAQLRISRLRAMDAQAAELRRLERDLHDGAQARLVALHMQLGVLTRTLRSYGPEAEAARSQAAVATESAQLALRELRSLVRGIHPPMLTDRGLIAALRTLADDNPVPTGLRVDIPDDLSPAVESAIYFVVAEALTNVAKHSQATDCLGEVHAESATVIISVTDNGCGGADTGGQGIRGLNDRVMALDGSLSLRSPVGGPTVLRAELPCA